MPEIAPVGSFHHRRYQKSTRGRLRTDVITFEEGLWLTIGLIFGWLAAKTTVFWVAIVPVVILLVLGFEKIYAQKYGLRTIHGRRTG